MLLVTSSASTIGGVPPLRHLPDFRQRRPTRSDENRLRPGHPAWKPTTFRVATDRRRLRFPAPPLVIKHEQPWFVTRGHLMCRVCAGTRHPGGLGRVEPRLSRRLYRRGIWNPRAPSARYASRMNNVRDILDAIRALPRPDRLKLAEALSLELEGEKGASSSSSNRTSRGVWRAARPRSRNGFSGTSCWRQPSSSSSGRTRESRSEAHRLGAPTGRRPRNT